MRTEWATDIAFDDPKALGRIYPQLVRGSMIAFGSKDVLRFLGKRLYPNCQEEVISSYRDRPEGIRVKHQAHANSVKVYDKAGSILRTECTINNARAFRVYRRSERDPQGSKRMLPMSKGIVDLYARSQVSQQVNDRYLEALAKLDTSERVEEVVLAHLPASHPQGQIDPGAATLVRGGPATAGGGGDLWTGRGFPQSGYCRPSLSKPSCQGGLGEGDVSAAAIARAQDHPPSAQDSQVSPDRERSQNHRYHLANAKGHHRTT